MIEQVTQAQEVSETMLTGEPKLYAGKFKTVEDLENGYRQSLPLYQKTKELESEINRYKTVPEKYNLPGDAELRETQFKELEALARSAGLNEEQFTKAAKSISEKIKVQNQTLDDKRKALGDEKSNLLKDFVSKNFGEFSDQFKSNIFNQLIRDEGATNNALKAREKQLNSQAPGINSIGAIGGGLEEAKRTREDLFKKANANPSDMVARNAYIKSCEVIAESKRANRKD
jgi:hypothetical protein